MRTALALLVQHGYLVLFGWVAIEQLGAPLPSSPLMLAAGALSTSGQINAGFSIAAVVLGCVLSDSIWFFLGRRWGDKVVRLICRISFEPQTCVRKTEGAMTKYGGKTLLFAKFIPGLNVVAAPIAGQSQMSYWHFLGLDFLGAFAWAFTFVVIGRGFGESVASAGLVLVAERFAVFVFTAILLALLARRFVRHYRFRKQAEGWRFTAGELKSRIDGGDNFHIVDLRPPVGDAVQDRSLPGALKQSASQMLKNIDHIPRDRDVVVFCACPGDVAAVALAMKLRKRGIDRVHPLQGGVESWEKEGFPLV